MCLCCTLLVCVTGPDTRANEYYRLRWYSGLCTEYGVQTKRRDSNKFASHRVPASLIRRGWEKGYQKEASLAQAWSPSCMIGRCARPRLLANDIELAQKLFSVTQHDLVLVGNWPHKIGVLCCSQWWPVSCRATRNLDPFYFYVRVLALGSPLYCKCNTYVQKLSTGDGHRSKAI